VPGSVKLLMALARIEFEAGRTAKSERLPQVGIEREMALAEAVKPNPLDVLELLDEMNSSLLQDPPRN